MRTKEQQKEFLSRPADGNVMRLAQAILAGDKKVRHQITYVMRQLNKHAYIKDLTMAEVTEAIRMISEKEM